MFFFKYIHIQSLVKASASEGQIIRPQFIVTREVQINTFVISNISCIEIWFHSSNMSAISPGGLLISMDMVRLLNVIN